MSSTIKSSLTSIEGIDAQTQEKLYALGLHRFDQLAELTESEIAELARELGIPAEHVAGWVQRARDLVVMAPPAAAPEAASGATAAEVASEPVSAIPEFLQPARKESSDQIFNAADEERVSTRQRQQARMGKLVENIPRKMRVGVPIEIEARISDEDLDALGKGMAGQITDHDLIVTDALTVELQAPQGGFTIQGLARQTQWISAKPLEAYGLTGLPGFGSWRWSVTPLERGRKPLVLAVSAMLQHDGQSAERTIGDQSFQIMVRINYAQTGKRVATWLAIAAAGGIASEFGPMALTWVKMLAR